MAKRLIGALVAAVILFLWQFLSWSVMGVHQPEFQYTANQDSVLQYLSRQLPEDGSYFLPQAPPGSSQEEKERYMEESMNRPWATINYHRAMEANMGMNMFRAFAVDFIAALLVIWLLLQFANLTVGRAILACLAVGGAGYFTIPYLNSIWFETSSLGYLIDAVVSWGLTGAWLGWWLTRRKAV